MTSNDFSGVLMLVAETRLDGRIYVSRTGLDPVSWEAFPELRQMKIDYVRQALLRHVARSQVDLTVRTFLWDGRREQALSEDWQADRGLSSLDRH
ncbi:hypothetical protein ABT024_04975 [Streptomyces sp. NPDC002812]|uniref:hypothetical protein n=1 Tax=Streptomyces sp. NPDC002812 TaxID=3154434 RepID=UPI0033294623